MNKTIAENELRSGNILQYYIGEDGCEWDYTRIDAEDILWCETKNENFNKVHRSVELTPEILEKAGFVIVNRDRFSNNFGYAFMENRHELIFYPPNNIYWHRFHIKDIGFLHDLQNWYYWNHSKEELTISLT